MGYNSTHVLARYDHIHGGTHGNDEALAQRIRAVPSGKPGIIEKKMFNDIAFMVDGNMACGVSKDSLMVRINPDTTEAVLAQPHVRVFDMTGGL